MKTLPITASDEDILQAVREWVDLLVSERYMDAFAYLYHPTEEYWTPDLIRIVITNYGSIEPHQDGRTFKVTSLRMATGEFTPYHECEITRDAETSGNIWIDLPLNGQWSDLTAILDFHAINGEIVLHLNDIHVM